MLKNIYDSKSDKKMNKTKQGLLVRIVAGCLLLLVVLLYLQTNETREAEEERLLTAYVTRVVDGDTIIVEVNGQRERVRLLCIDTPELNSSHSEPPQPFAQEATDYLNQSILNQTIELEIGLGSGRDRYDRLLAYVYLDGTLINKALISEGFARVAYIIPPNTACEVPFRVAEQMAKAAEIGIWGLRNYVQSDGFHLISE
jgi:micrococcal nuclease